MRLREFDNKKLAQYKTAAAADAKKADAEGDFARGNKRFKGINTATKKQFANDAKKSQLKEFAPSGDDSDGFGEEILKRLAAQWWNNDEDPRVEQTLMSAGWEIGQDDGYDNGGVFVVQAGDDQGDSYISWSAEDLQMNETAPPGARAERMVKHIKQGYARDGKLTPKEKGIAFATAWKAHNAGRVEEGEYQDDYEDEETELCNGCYVRDKEDSSGEIFVMRGDPGDRRVRIEDQHGRGWNIAPYRLTVVDDSDPDIAAYFGDELDEAGVTEAAQGHTIEAHGVRGMDRRTWHKTFRNTDQMIAWAEKHDAEIIGTRDLEQARHHNLSPARQGVAEGYQDPQSELKLINQKLKDAYKHVRNNSSVSIGWYMSQVKELKARREELIKQLKQGVAEADKHSFIGRIQRHNELKNKVDRTWKDAIDAEKQGDKSGATRAFNKHVRYTNLERPGTWRTVKDNDVTEMDKSEPSAGRDTGPRPGPDREAKPVAAKKATRDAGRMLNKAFRDSHKKKDVSEDSLAAMQRLAGIVPQVPLIVSNGQRQYRHMPTAVQPR